MKASSKLHRIQVAKVRHERAKGVHEAVEKSFDAFQQAMKQLPDAQLAQGLNAFQGWLKFLNEVTGALMEADIALAVAKAPTRTRRAKR